MGNTVPHSGRKAGIVIEPAALRADGRGWVNEPLDAEGLAAQRNVHVVWTVPDGIRGNHYHMEGTEVFLLYGPAQFRYREEGAVRDLMVMPGEVFRITIPPLVSHAIRNTGDKAMVMVAFNSVLHDPANPDTRSDILI
jgi:dTDP-4-dehydrorhamnose 3,5-epimerase-like enzyme